ncbi:MAG: methyltransferase domain-containing protein [Chloroflexi bacterium]|nr:methyltransferase domain-containing protein [Chloroflexota bacterium]MYD17482.1 methyltransferase domain-containing protein [Chloroflexota bacterium]MYJ01519.1 methyltransferase domain-containing protein [Chloroflexota bacterium]
MTHRRPVGDDERRVERGIVRHRRTRARLVGREAHVRNEDIAETFNRSAAAYEESAPELINLAASELIKRLNLQPDSDLVDLGCGPGAVIAHAAPLLTRGSAVGADLSRVQLELARDRFRRAVLAPRFIQEDAAATGLRDRSASAVSLGFVLPYAERPLLLLKEATRLTRLGGRVAATVIGTPFFGSAGTRLLGHLERRGVVRPDVEMQFDPREAVRLALLSENDERRLDDVTIEEIEREFWWDSFDDWWGMLDAFGFLPTDRERMIEAIAGELREDDRVVDPDGQVRCPVKIWLLSATVCEGDPWL